ncbi:CCA tRNA nucleotidyltransferase [Paracoccus albus]|uniref:CCA tRNA nucleotidyltransferase n=1 Tax=Paracoccus albus TaxID=3017784 RepID=UPI0022F0AC80|nr:CCA tRNA nucleotidyltransferase [Paracoccus albus]WBU60201.1 CCA tRNA nucleotidyltransferase [Paracoccus albus]
MRVSAAFLDDPALRRVLTMLENGGHRAFVVGGAVRNAVLGQPVDDIDIATDAIPLRVVELATAEGLKTVPTGIEHGTVTVIANGTPFEVTTFRRDVETDGRNATVAFSDRIEDDAARRDFTMNALYATASGKVLDPVGGWPDLRRRVLRFVGDPTARIREDYLRILRFFRFYAWYADSSAPGATEAITAEKEGLPRVSAERIGAEMRKLLSAPDPSHALALMAQTGVLSFVLAGADISAMPALIEAEKTDGTSPDWLRRLSLIAAQVDLAGLRLSRAETNRLKALTLAAELSPAEAGYYHGQALAHDAMLVRLARREPLPEDWQEQVGRAANAALPIAATDLMPDLQGAALGRGLKAAEELWLASGFSSERAALIETARQAGKQDA